jgi:hypothetical protein
MFVPIPGEIIIFLIVLAIGGLLLYGAVIVVGVLVMLILSPRKEHFPSLFGDDKASDTKIT